MNSLIIKKLIGSAVRHLLTLVSGYLVARGILTEAESLELVIAGVSTLTALIWSGYQKLKEEQNKGSSF